MPTGLKIALRYTRRVLKATDQWANVLTGGEVGETISSRAGRLQQKGVFGACILCRVLDIFEKDHCQKSLEQETPQ